MAFSCWNQFEREPRGVYLGASGGAVFRPGTREISAAWQRPSITAYYTPQPRKTQSSYGYPIPDRNYVFYRLRGRIGAWPLSPLNGYEHAILCLARFPV